MAVLPAVRSVIEDLAPADQESWRAQLALQLAESIDEQPNASMARELRSVMNELQSVMAPAEEDDLDKIINLNAKRRSASQG